VLGEFNEFNESIDEWLLLQQIKAFVKGGVTREIA
jgi:hypothetical protein